MNRPPVTAALAALVVGHMLFTAATAFVCRGWRWQ